MLDFSSCSSKEPFLCPKQLDEIFSAQTTLDALKQSYARKAVDYILGSQRTLSMVHELVLLFQEPVDVNLHAQLLQLLEYLPIEQRTIFVMKTLLHLFKKASYVHRSHLIKFITCIPAEQRTLEAIQEMTIFFQQVATDWRYDIFNMIQKIVKEERYEIIHAVSKIIRESDDWLFLAKRTPAIIEAIHRIHPKKRAEACLCCQQYPIVFLQENIFSAICCFCPDIIESEQISNL